MDWIYWIERDLASIGRAKLDGTESNAEWLKEIGGEPRGIAVDATYVYWTSTTKQCIGRVKHDGTGVEKEWLKITEAALRDVEVNSTHIYWVRENAAIGRAKIDGTSVEKSFITSNVSNVTGIALDSTFLYWTLLNGLRRAKLDGTESTALLTDSGVAPIDVCVNGTHVYWTVFTAPGRIGRAKIDGSSIEKEFVKEAGQARGVVINDPNFVYWITAAVIGRVKPDGTGAEKEWFTPPAQGFDLALLIEGGEEEEEGIHKPNSATVNVSVAAGVDLAQVLEPDSALVNVSVPSGVDLVGGPATSSTEREAKGLPLPFPSVLANPGRLGPPRFTSAERKTLRIDRNG